MPPTFEQRWTAWGAAFGGSSRERRSGGRLHDMTARGRLRGRPRLSGHARHRVRLRARRRRHQLESAQGLGGGSSDTFQAGVYGSRSRAGSIWPARWPSPITDVTPTAPRSRRQLTAASGQSYRRAARAGYRYAHRRMRRVTPYAAVQAQAFARRATARPLTGSGFGLAYFARNATDTRSELGARFDTSLTVDGHAADAARPARLGARLVSNPARAPPSRRCRARTSSSTARTPAGDSALASAGASAPAERPLIAKFDGEFAATQTYAGTGTLRYT